MAKRNVLTAIDVGTTKICTIVAEMGERGLNVLGVGINPSAGMHKALVVNINEARESIRESIHQAEKTSGHHIESALIGVTGRHITSWNNRGVVSINRNDRVVRDDDLKRVLQSAQNMRLTPDRKLLHVIPRDYAIDGQTGVKNPIGMHGFRLDAEMHLITAAVASVQNLVKCITGVGVDVEDLILEPLASSEAVLTEEERQVGVILADIGGGTTDIAIFRDGSIWHTAVLPVAGYQITRDISIGLGLPFEVAEEMKRKYGNVMNVYEGKSGTPNPLSEDGHGVSYQDMCDIIRTRMDELLRLTLLELPRQEYEKVVPAGLVLTGGSSSLPGLAALGNDILKMPVRIGVPNGAMYGVDDKLRNPAYATAVGLLLWEAKYKGAQAWQGHGLTAGIRRFALKLKSLFR